MLLDNGILHVEFTNKGGEMALMTYKGMDILYKGDGEYWGGKNPSLFPLIGSPSSKQYVLDGKTYPIKNHGLIRYANLETVVDTPEQVTMRLVSSDETLAQYPFKFTYEITYRLDGHKVLIDYMIRNDDKVDMPFTFGLHPGFMVEDFDKMVLHFPEDETGTLIDQKDGKEVQIKLGDYTNFIKDVTALETVVLKDLKSSYCELKQDKYSVKVDMSKFDYLGLWTADPNSHFMCIEPWMSFNRIKDATNPFSNEFDQVVLKPSQAFLIDYYIEVE